MPGFRSVVRCHRCGNLVNTVILVNTACAKCGRLCTAAPVRVVRPGSPVRVHAAHHRARDAEGRLSPPASASRHEPRWSARRVQSDRRPRAARSMISSRSEEDRRQKTEEHFHVPNPEPRPPCRSRRSLPRLPQVDPLPPSWSRSASTRPGAHGTQRIGGAAAPGAQPILLQAKLNFAEDVRSLESRRQGASVPVQHMDDRSAGRQRLDDDPRLDTHVDRVTGVCAEIRPEHHRRGIDRFLGDQHRGLAEVISRTTPRIVSKSLAYSHATPAVSGGLNSCGVTAGPKRTRPARGPTRGRRRRQASRAYASLPVFGG